MKQATRKASRHLRFESVEARHLLATDLVVEVDQFAPEAPGDRVTRTIRIFNNGDTVAVDAIVRTELSDQLLDATWTRKDGLAQFIRGKLGDPGGRVRSTPLNVGAEDTPFGDLDGDGRDDLIRITRGNNPANDHAAISFGDNRSFVLPTAAPYIVAVGDVNADMLPDYIAGDYWTGFSLLLGGSEPTAISITTDIADSWSAAPSITFGDVTGDGIDDVVMYFSGPLFQDSTASDKEHLPAHVGIGVIPGSTNLTARSEFDLRRSGILLEVKTPFFARVSDFGLTDANGDGTDDLVMWLSRSRRDIEHDYVIFGGPELKSMDFGLRKLDPLDGENGFAGNLTSRGVFEPPGLGSRVHSRNGDIFDRLTIPAGESVIYTATGILKQDATATIDTSAVSGDGADEDITNNAEIDSSLVHLTTSLAHTSLAVGQEATFELTIENLAPTAANEVQISETISATLEDPSWSLRTINAFSPEASGTEMALLGSKVVGWNPEVGSFHQLGEISGSLGDINGDGADDFFVSRGPRTWQVVDVFLGGEKFVGPNAVEGFTPTVRIHGLPGVEQVFAIGDRDGDGFDDFFVDDGNSKRVFFGQDFRQLELMLTQDELRSEPLDIVPTVLPTVVDINADGLSDQVEIEGRTLRITLGSNVGEETNEVSITQSPDWLPRAFTVGDFNSDGIDDLVVGSDDSLSSQGEVMIIFGGATFFETDRVRWITTGASHLSRPHKMTLTVLDVNGDGLDDILITNTADGPRADNGAFSGSMQIVLGRIPHHVDGEGEFNLSFDIDGTVGAAIIELTGTVTESTLAENQYIHLITHPNQYQLDQRESTVEIDSPAHLQGDIDGDGRVDFRDFLLFADDFGKTAPELTGSDINRDGIVDFYDFLLLQSRFGEAS